MAAQRRMLKAIAAKSTWASALARPIADGLQPHAVLERGEGGLDGSPASGDETIVSLEPRR